MRFFKIADVDLIDLDHLVRMLPDAKSWDVVKMLTRGQYVTAMLQSWDSLNDAEINTPLRLAHFIGQGLIETGFLKSRSENLNYSAAGLLKIFGKYYKDKPELVKLHARKPQLIANYVYAKLNGNKEPNDGWLYRGRGFIQLTGRDNYKLLSEKTGLNLEENPDLIANDLKASIKVAAMFWKTNGLNRFADLNQGRSVSRGINRGDPKAMAPAHDEDKRILWTNYVLGLMNAPEIVLNDPNKPLDIGSRGDRVKILQSDLISLNYNASPADGIFGKTTRLAVIAFQDDHGLEINGLGDAPTLDAIKEALNNPNALPNANMQKLLKDTYKHLLF